jgi:hypothetical protein
VPGKHFVLISQRKPLARELGDAPGLAGLAAGEQLEFPSGIPLQNHIEGLFSKDPFLSASVETIPERYNFLSELRVLVPRLPTSHFEFRLQANPAGSPGT